MIRVDQESTIPNTDFRNEFFSIDQGGRQTRIIPPIGYSSVSFRRFLETKACNRSLALAVSENLNPSYLTTFSKVVGCLQVTPQEGRNYTIAPQVAYCI